jgi:hypothetical protein
MTLSLSAPPLVEPELPRPEGPAEPRTRRPALRVPARSRSRPALPGAQEEGTLCGWLLRRLSPGEATLWVGPPSTVEPVLEDLYACVAGSGGPISLVEGANRFHPYRIGERARCRDLDAESVLARIRLARSFTAYQLVGLVDRWEREVRRHPPALLVAHDLPAMFEGEELPREERVPLLRHVAQTLHRLLDRTRLPLLLVLPGGFDRFPGLADQGPRFAEMLRFRPGPERLAVESYRDGRTLAIVARPPGQRGLEEFASTGRSEVIAWAAPSRPTARRSRSG